MGENIGRKTILSAIAALFAVVGVGLGTTAVAAKELKLSYFVGPNHPMNAAVFTPFSEKLAELSGGELTVKHFPGGTLNAAPPQQYSRLLEGVADVTFGLPGYTGQLFPITNTVVTPGLVSSAVDATERMQAAMDLIASEYDAKVLAIWANDIKTLMTRDKPVRSLEDVEGMTIRAAAPQDLPYIESWGASAVATPVTEVHQSLTNGTIDGVYIGASGIGSFKLWEPANYITTGIPASTSAFFLLMNKEVWESLTPQEQAWVDEASGHQLAMSGAAFYDKAGAAGLALAAEKGVELIELSDDEAQRFAEVMAPAIKAYAAQELRDGVTGAMVIEAMGGLTQ